jgi:hypothetical protein
LQDYLLIFKSFNLFQAGAPVHSLPFYRRVILVEVDHTGRRGLAGADLFSFESQRVPLCFVDVNTETGKIAAVHKVGTATAWKDVPTPAI